MTNPKLRFKCNDGVAYPAWTDAKIKDMGTFIRGLTYSRENVVNEGNGVLVVRSSNIVDGDFVDVQNDLQFVDVDSAPVLKKDDVVICTANGSIGLVGKTSFYLGNFDGKISWGAFCSVFRGNDSFAKYIFRTNRYRLLIAAHKQGGNGALGNLNINFLSEETVPRPSSCEEADKISNFLSAIDKKISITRSDLSVLEKLKAGLIQKIFSQEIRFKQEGGAVTEKWQKYRFDDLIQLKSGQDFSPDDYNDKRVGVPYLTGASCINKGKSIANRWTEKPRCFGYRGDIIIVCKGNGVGKVAIVDQDVVHIARQFMAVRTVTEKLDQNFCFYLIQHHMKQIIGTAAGFIIGLSRQSVLGIDVEIPFLSEQIKISKLLLTLDNKIELVERRLDNFIKSKQAFMQQMFV